MIPSNVTDTFQCSSCSNTVGFGVAQRTKENNGRIMCVRCATSENNRLQEEAEHKKQVEITKYKMLVFDVWESV